MSEEYMLRGKMNRPTQAEQNSFISAQNEAKLDRLLYQDLQRQFGMELNDKQKARMVKAVRHYMEEAQEKMIGQPIQAKNTSVLLAAKQDMMSYINRSFSAPPVEEQDVSRMDVASRFNQLQNERQGTKATPPPPPNFRLEFKDDGPSALSQFEMAKKAREEEVARGEQIISQTMRADAEFSSALRQANQQDQLVLQDRERSRLTAQREAQAEMATRLVTPDPRRMFMKDILDGNPQGQGTSLESLLNGQSGLADANMTLAYPSAIRTKPPQQADTIIRQDDILAYKENEYNLIVYSADRDWFLNKSQNRYNFTVNFDPANNGPGQTFAPSATVRFKNITRIELVKTILPIEGVDILQTVTTTSPSVTYSTALNMNILGFPYLNVYIPELDTNNFGTDYYLNQAFAQVQYDANWISDNNTSSKGGFLAMIPKFLKCQKVYTPTPLATLRKLSISIQRPDGCLVSDTLDTLDISGVVSSYAFTTAGSTVAGTNYADATGTYLWIATKTWFSRFTVNQGDRIQIQGVTFPGSYTGNSGARDDLISFLTRQEGHIVVGIAYNSAINTFVDGQNSVGYSDYIIIRSKMVDPTTGSTAVDTFGKLSAAANQTFLNTLTPSGGTVSTGRLINLSHQTTLVFRVITRDLDPTTRLRPDNM